MQGGRECVWQEWGTCQKFGSGWSTSTQFFSKVGFHTEGFCQFFDYTIAPLHEQLLENPPTPKYNVFFDAVGLGDPSLYINSEGYLAPNGIFLSSGPQPTSILSTFRAVWHIYLRPRWAGGTKRTYRPVFVTFWHWSLSDISADGPRSLS